MWTIAAPWFQQRTASAAISSSVIGSAGFWSFVPALPVSAAETIRVSGDMRTSGELRMENEELRNE
jgi:hypothetical protein